MNVQKLNKCIEMMKTDLGEGLIGGDIYSSEDGQAIAGYKSVEAACALFSQMTEFVNNALKGSSFPLLGKYYLLDLADNKMVVIVPLGDYQFGMMVDKTLIKLGLLLNVSIPKFIDAFEDALMTGE